MARYVHSSHAYHKALTNIKQDESLEQAVKEIDAKIDKEIAKLRDKKWPQVATHVADLIQKKKYTQRLCRERYESLMDGSALTPIELDSDEEGRAELRTTRIATNKRLREEAAAAQEAEEQMRLAARIAKKEARAANVVVRITKAQQKKLDEEKISNMRKQSIAARKAQKAIMSNWVAYMKVDLRWATRKQNVERRVTNRLLGLPLSYHPSRYNHVDENEAEVEAVATIHVPDDPEEVDLDEDAAAEDEDDDNINDDASTVAASSRCGSVEVEVDDNPTPNKKQRTSSSPCSPARSSKSTSPKHLAPGEATVTNQTRTSPRSVMTVDELNVVLVSRDLPRASDSETHEQVVARLCEEDSLSTQSALRTALKASGVASGSFTMSGVWMGARELGGNISLAPVSLACCGTFDSGTGSNVARSVVGGSGGETGDTGTGGSADEDGVGEPVLLACGCAAGYSASTFRPKNENMRKNVWYTVNDCQGAAALCTSLQDSGR